MESINLNINVKTKPKCLNDISQNISNYINNSEITNGLCTLFIKHTSASLVIQENADPAVLRDIESFFTRFISEDEKLYEHNSEGPDDMPAHIQKSFNEHKSFNTNCKFKIRTRNLARHIFV